MGLWLLLLGSSLFCHCSCHRRVLSFLRGYSPFLRGVSSHSLLRLVLGPLPSRGHRLLHGCTLPHRYASFICGVLGRPSLRLMELRGSRLPSLASSGLVCLSCVCLVAVAPRGYVSFFRGSSSHFLLGFVLGLTSPLLELRGFRLPSLASSRSLCLTCGCFVAVAPRGHSSFFRGSLLSPRRHASFLCGTSGLTFTRLVAWPSSSRGNGLLQCAGALRRHGCRGATRMVWIGRWTAQLALEPNGYGWR